MHLQAILRFTDSQQQDMLHLRRLFYGKLGQLARERASILQQVDAAEPSGQPLSQCHATWVSGILLTSSLRLKSWLISYAQTVLKRAEHTCTVLYACIAA